MKTAAVFIVALILGATSSAFAQQWTPMGGGMSGSDFDPVVDRLVEIDGKLYACGYFSKAGGIDSWSIAYWLDGAWQSHGTGVDSTYPVLDVVKFNNEILAIITLGIENAILAWDGDSWRTFPADGLGVANYFTDAEVHNGELYVLQDASGIFKFTGSSWTLIPGSDQLLNSRAMRSYKSELYIGCQDGLYKYNGSSIQPVWKPANVYGLKVIDDTLYMTGAYLGVSTATDTMTGVATYDGSQVRGFGTPFPVDTTEFTEYIFDVTKLGDRLVAAGDVHDDIFGESRIITYNNGQWETIGVADDIVKSVVTIGNTVYAGGWFYNIDAQPFSNVAALQLGENRISGRVFLNMDDTCSFDLDDIPLKQRIVKALPGPVYRMTDANGNYIMFLDTGSYTLEVIPDQYLGPECPPSGVHTITVPDDANPSFDFALKPAVNCVALRPYLTSTRKVICRQSQIYLVIANEGGLTATNVVVGFVLSRYQTLVSSDHSYEVQGNNMFRFTIPSIAPQDQEIIVITDSVICDFANFDSIAFIGIVVTSDVASCGDTTDRVDLPIVGPYDPNEKLVAAQDIEGRGYVKQDTIDGNDLLTYQIHFQNVGTDYAQRVVIHDTLSPLLDISTIKTLSGSHNYSVQITGDNSIAWTFDNIFLPDSTTDNVGSNGSIRYQIRQSPGNLPGTIITNKAAIYFDFNPPVITNQTVNVIGQPSAVRAGKQLTAEIEITPNPAEDMVFISLPLVKADAQITFYSVLGKEVYSVRSELPASLTLSTLDKGMYTVHIRSSDGKLYIGKLILQ